MNKEPKRKEAEETLKEMKKLLGNFFNKPWPNPPDEQQWCLEPVSHILGGRYCGHKLPCPTHSKN